MELVDTREISEEIVPSKKKFLFANRVNSAERNNDISGGRATS